MKCICLTGPIHSDLELVSTLLQQAGMKLAQPADRGESIDITNWHDQALTLETEATEKSNSVINLGRFMDQMASDIFIANIKADPWGWADTRSTWLLDYWVNFDPRLYFVLVYVTPQQMLANVMSTSTETVSVDAIMATWQAHYQQLLRFHLRNPQRSILVDAYESLQNPQAFLKHCEERWSLSFSSFYNKLLPIDTRHDSLALYISEQLTESYPEVISLQHEIAATLTRFSENEQLVPTLTGDNLIKSYRALQDRSTELNHIQIAYEELAIVKTQLSHTITDYQQQQQENELLLSQLHQVQEELEAYFIKNEAGQKQVETLASQLATLNEAYQRQKHLDLERQTQIKQLTQQHNEAITLYIKQQEETSAERTIIQQENKLLLSQLHQVQKEREAYRLKNEVGHKQVDDLTVKVTTLTQSAQQQSQLAKERQTQIEQLTQQYNDAVANHLKQQEEETEKQKIIQQENELFLLQLHQVQEELERYFLQHQIVQQQLHHSETCIQRILERNQNYCDYESMVVLSVANDKTSSIWQLKNLIIAGRYLPHLTFKLILEEGIAGLVFTKQQDNNGPFIRWPTNVKAENEVTIILAGKEGLLRQRIKSLIELSVSDWNLVKALCGFIETTLKNPQTNNLPIELDYSALSAGLKALRNSFEKLPALLRYDQLTIKREQVTADYEYLWLHITNLGYGNARWPEFEFRLSCTNVLQDNFGAHPKLEFPEVSTQKVLESWFIESSDDFGAKMELRFALPTLMDLDVWQRLSENDKKLLTALITHLPVMLSHLQDSEPKIKRPWQNWIDMTQAMLHILNSQTVQPVLAEQDLATQKLKFADAFKANITLLAKPEIGQSTKKAKNQ